MIRKERIVIIGGGASGVCVAYELQKLGLKPLILEQGNSAGWSWFNMPRSISLLSPWKRNYMNGTKLTFSTIHKMHSCKEYGQYLCDYVDDNSLEVLSHTKVKSVKKDTDGVFEVNTGSNIIKSDIVINATGYFFNPVFPEYKNGTGEIPSLHVQEFVSAQWIKEKYPKVKKVLVVGGRISSGQTATELQQSSFFDVAISSRTPIKFAQSPTAQKLAFWVYYLWEDLVAKFRPHVLKDTKPPMEGGETKKLINSGVIKVFPDIECFDGRNVRFVDQQQSNFDLIIFATGFAPELSHIDVGDCKQLLKKGSGFESNRYQNLFFLGIDHQVNFRSRYLRGIREDAIVLAKLIYERVQ